MAAGIKIENIEQLRAQYARGDSIRELATQYGCHRGTVLRWCRGIERPEPPEPLTVEKISTYLRNWKPIRRHEHAHDHPAI